MSRRGVEMFKQYLNHNIDQTEDKTRKVRGLRNFAHQVRKLRKEEDGAMVILALFIFIFMLAMGGIGIDTMRHEMERAHLHAVLDNAVLAGAAAPDGRDPKTIVTDYFAKSEMSEYLHDFQDGDVVSTMNATKVSARASMTLDTYLMKLSGVNTLSASTAATAERRIPKLEIVLVLDVSGSMRNNSKIENLRIAAKDFVTTILNASLPGDTVISIVPFSTSVTPTEGIYNVLAVEDTHQYSNCIYLEENDYTHPSLATGNSSLSTGTNMKQMIYTSMYGDFDDLNQDWRSCYTDEYFRILPYSISETELNNKIDGLLAAGNTSTEQGVKWGSALLGPRFREVSAALINNGEIDGSLSRVPVDYGEPETLKIMIVMGDGENTTTYFFDKSNPEFRGAHSDLFEYKMQDHAFDYAFQNKNKDKQYTDASYYAKCGTQGWICIYKATGPIESVYYLKDPTPYDRDNDGDVDSFYDVANDEWRDDGYMAALEGTANSPNPDFISKEQLSWEQAWGLMSPHYYGRITGDWDAWNDYRYSEQVTGALKNTRMGKICTTLKGEGAFIYSVGFEIPDGGTAEENLKNCASSVEHYYRAQGLSITDAFSSIAANVQNLRLTQ